MISRYRKYTNKLRFKIITHYGGKCACCNLSDYRFLTIDHINNDGAEQRRKNNLSYKGGKQTYLWIIRNNYPTDLQILCWNCNCGKQANGGICPHKTV